MGPTASKVASLADGTRSVQEIASMLGVQEEYVRATVERLGLRDRIKWKRPQSTKGRSVSYRRLALIRRAHDAMSRREPDGISTAAWDQLVADMAKELGVGNG